ncbi:MAG: hypothetical protein WKH64_10065, partial [Chloroflexia bacterium]
MLGRHTIEQTLHLCALTLEVFDQVVERLDTGREVVPVLVHELLESVVGVDPLHPLVEQLVEVAHHLAHTLHIFRPHLLDRLLH